tara:strand:+ start:1508 stop:1762 length:255 start_codon:yes stop_codon:yes gene_type:complete
MNDVKLQEGHPLTENLNVLKVGGKSSSLELSQHGDGCRVTGNFEATGNITGSPLTLDYDNISTSDPSVKGAVWRDGTDLKISAG